MTLEVASALDRAVKSFGSELRRMESRSPEGDKFRIRPETRSFFIGALRTLFSERLTHESSYDKRIPTQRVHSYLDGQPILSARWQLDLSNTDDLLPVYFFHPSCIPVLLRLAKEDGLL